MNKPLCRSNPFPPPHNMLLVPVIRHRATRFPYVSMARLMLQMVLVTVLILPAESQSVSEVDGTSRHHKRDHRHGDLPDLPEARIESSVRPMPSQAAQWRSERKKPYGGPYLNTKWKDPANAPHNSFLKGGKTVPERVSTTEKEDLAERQKRTEAEKSSLSSWQGSNHLSLKDGAYEGLVVEVSPRVPQSDCKTVIDGTQVGATLSVLMLLLWRRDAVWKKQFIGQS